MIKNKIKIYKINFYFFFNRNNDPHAIDAIIIHILNGSFGLFEDLKELKFLTLTPVKLLL
jgi:hypothetical protein